MAINMTNMDDTTRQRWVEKVKGGYWRVMELCNGVYSVLSEHSSKDGATEGLSCIHCWPDFKQAVTIIKGCGVCAEHNKTY